MKESHHDGVSRRALLQHGNNDDRVQLFVRDGEWLPALRPPACKPVAGEDRSITYSSRCVRITWKSGGWTQRGERRKLRSSHDLKNFRHNVRSTRNSSLRRIGWSSRRKVTKRLIMRRGNVRPWSATLHAYWKLLIRESNSLDLQYRFCNQTSSKEEIRWKLPYGRRACNLIESSSIPSTLG